MSARFTSCTDVRPEVAAFESYEPGLSIAEIASRYGISESKVKTQLHRTRNKLQLFLEKEGISV
jgi:DNA-directed RNA polymerase specialized sigma24 family protein